MVRSRRVWLLALCSAAGLCAAACLSPTLPLPPPAVPDVEQIGEGQYRLTGTIPIPGKVVVDDVQSGLGYSKLVAHAYQFDIAARPGDLMRVHYESGDDVSDFAEFQIPKPVMVAAPEPADAGTPPPSDAAAARD